MKSLKEMLQLDNNQKSSLGLLMVIESEFRAELERLKEIHKEHRSYSMTYQRVDAQIELIKELLGEKG